MKTHRFSLLFSLLILVGVVLSGCTGTSLTNTWPGVTSTEKIVYLADKDRVYAIDASTGAETWQFPPKRDASKPFYAPPAVSDNLIVVGNYGHMLYGLDLNGAQKWAFDSESGYFVGGSLILENMILAPSSNNALFAVSLDGKELWKFETNNAIWATPASDGQLAFVPSLDHFLYALKLSDGSVVWKKDLGSAMLSAPILTQDGTLYVSTMNGDVVAVKASDGSVLWTAKTGGQIWATPAQHEDSLYVGNVAGKVSAISAKDGSILWQKDAGSPIIAGGAVIPEGVVFPTEGGTVIAWSRDGQKELWRQTINGKLYTTPVVPGQKLVVAVTSGDKLLQSYNLNGQADWLFVEPK